MMPGQEFPMNSHTIYIGEPETTKMKRVHSFASGFLDVEASVDNDGVDSDDSEDEDRDLQDAFIDNSNDNLNSHMHQRFMNIAKEREEELREYMFDQMLTRAYAVSSFARSTPEDWTSCYSEIIAALPTEDDYPIWKVVCKIGFEEMIVMTLLEKAQDAHELRSAFTRGSMRGYIYLECQMNPQLIELLNTIPGIIRTHQGIRRRQIGPLDYPDLLHMQSITTNFAVGNWVLVQKGLYKGDVGLVSATHKWAIDILLIPRLSYQPEDRKQKRKASSIKYEAKLFDLNEFRRTSSANIISRLDGSFVLGQLHIEHGLVLKSFDYHSISSRVNDISWSHFSLFVSSGHPQVNVASLPRPREWIFSEQEKVTIHSSAKYGIIRSIELVYVDVELEEEGVHRFNWRDIRKHIALGDFVSVISGPEHGYKGWVVELIQDTATVMDKITQDRMKAVNFRTAKNAIEVHINCLAVAEAPFQFTPQPTSSQPHIDKPIRHPWCGAEVVISKLGHPLKGEIGHVVEVLFLQNTYSGMKLEVRLSKYDPTAPFRRITIDYDDVVESTTHLELRKYFDNSKIGLHKISAIKNTSATLHQSTFFNSLGSGTPIPSESSSTPAWDPSSATPSGMESWILPIQTNPYKNSPPNNAGHSSAREPDPLQTITSEPVDGKHILFKKALIGVKLNVVMKEGPFKGKEGIASISVVNGQLSLRYNRHTTSHSLQSEWVDPKFPNPTHDNGLLIVIDGEHCGKYVRRIYHRHIGDGRSFMILAVVNRTEGHADLLTGEQLELDHKVLCTVSETKEDKRLNKDIMNELRNSYPKP